MSRAEPLSGAVYERIHRDQVRIWTIAHPGAVLATLFDAHGSPIMDADYEPPPVQLTPSYVTAPRRDREDVWPEGPLLTRDRAIGRAVAI